MRWQGSKQKVVVLIVNLVYVGFLCAPVLLGVRASHTSQQTKKRRDMDRLYNLEADLDQYADDAYYYDKFLQTLNN
jgi:hypothetical protein